MLRAPMNTRNFESRKRDHLRLALDPRHQASGQSGFDTVHLIHEALPEMDFVNVDVSSEFFGQASATPLFISSMTAGHKSGEGVNAVLAEAASQRRWPMGVGSQRRELSDSGAGQEWKRLRKRAPHAVFFGNVGLAQVITHSPDKLLKLTENLGAVALIVHLNALQEAIQPEGTPEFQGGFSALEALVKKSNVPVIVKETGCGFSPTTLARLSRLGVRVIDVAGKGGTHWGRIEGSRAPARSKHALAAETFANWGESTLDSLEAATALPGRERLEIWASGGIRTGLDAAKAIAMGADKVGFAQPALIAAQKGPKALDAWMEKTEFELRLALFCTGSANTKALKEGKKWRKV